MVLALVSCANIGDLTLKRGMTEIGAVDLSGHSRRRECIDTAVTKAVADVNRPELDALHSATIGGWRVASEQLSRRGS